MTERGESEGFPPRLGARDVEAVSKALRGGKAAPRRRNSKRKVDVPVSGVQVRDADAAVVAGEPVSGDGRPAGGSHAPSAPVSASDSRFEGRCQCKVRPCPHSTGGTLMGGLLAGQRRVQGTGSPLEPSPHEQNFVTAGGGPVSLQRPPSWDGVKLIGWDF